MLLLILAALSVPIGSSDHPDPPAGRPPSAGGVITADALVKGLIDQHDSLTALSLVYEQIPISPPGEPTGQYSRRLLAVRRPGFFLRDNGHGHDRLHWSDDPNRKTLLITPTEGGILENLNRSVSFFEVKHSGPAIGDIQNELILRVLCWWPFTDWPPPEILGRPWSMSSLLKGGAYSLRPQTEAVGSRPCYVLEAKDTDLIWLDCERPRCVLRRDIYNRTTRSLTSRFEMSDYRDEGEGIWLPGRLRNLQFDSYAHTAKLRERVVIDATFLTRDVMVNGAVDPGIFRLDLAPGTLRKVVSNGVSRFEPMGAGQSEHFQSILNWGRKYAIRPASRPPSRVWSFALFGMIGGALSFAFWRWSMARRPGAPLEMNPDRA